MTTTTATGQIKETLADIMAASEVLAAMELAPEEMERYAQAVHEQAREKVVSMALAVQHIEAEQEVRTAAIDRLQARGRTADARIAWLKGLMKAALESETLALGTVRHPLVSVSLRTSPPSIEVTDEGAIPPVWKRATIVTLLSEVPEALLPGVRRIEVEKKELLAQALEGKPLPPGVRLAAAARHLVIR